MSTFQLKTMYKKNSNKLKKLRDLYKKTEDNIIIEESIKNINKEQDILSKNIRKDIYSSFSKNTELFGNSIKKKEKMKKKEIVIDRDNVVITKVEEIKDEPIKVINITGEEDKKCDDITEVLKKKLVSESELEFDGKYKLIYNNGIGYFEEELNEILCEHNLEVGNVDFNFNISKLLKDFDNKNNTNLNKRYKDNELVVEYDLNKLKKKDKKYLKQMRKIAKMEAKHNDNVIIKDDRSLRFKTGLACVAAAGLLLLGGMGIKNLNKNSSNNSTNSNTYTTEASTNIEVSTIKEDSNILKAVAKERYTRKVLKNKTNEKVTNNASSDDSLKIGGVCNLDNIDLYYASTDDKPVGNTKYIVGNYSYKASIISVVYKNQVMNLYYNDSININELEKICKEKYGDDVKISINFDLVDENGNVVTEHVGWVDNADLSSKGKVLTR